MCPSAFTSQLNIRNHLLVNSTYETNLQEMQRWNRELNIRAQHTNSIANSTYELNIRTQQEMQRQNRELNEQISAKDFEIQALKAVGGGGSEGGSEAAHQLVELKEAMEKVTNNAFSCSCYPCILLLILQLFLWLCIYPPPHIE